MPGTATDLATATGVARSQITKPVTTLRLVDFAVKSPQSARMSCTDSSNDYFVTVGLAVSELDSNGFVTDNVPFIHEVQTFGLRKNAPELAQFAIDTAKHIVGHRLVSVDVDVRGIGNAKLVWPKGASSITAPALETGRSFALREMVLDAELVNNAVCGGYDGSFRADLLFTLPNGQNWSRHASKDLRGIIADRFGGNVLKASCEELAGGLVHIAARNVPGITSAIGRVYNLTGFAETEWIEGMPVSPFPRQANPKEIRETRNKRRSEEYRPRAC